MPKTAVWVGVGPKPPISPLRLLPLFNPRSRLMAAMEEAAKATEAAGPGPLVGELFPSGEDDEQAMPPAQFGSRLASGRTAGQAARL